VDDLPGRTIVKVAWIGNALFALTAVPVALGAESVEGFAVGVALVAFGLSMVVWVWALGAAFVRSANGDDIAVASLFLTAGEVPRSVRRHLFGALLVCLLIAAATAAAEPFGVLVPMLPLGLIGLWGARHGTYPVRTR